MNKILCIDGGGMRGFLSSRVLAEFERMTGKSCHQHFGLMAGTSIGGISVLKLAMGTPAIELQRFFTNDGPKIFRRPWFPHLGLLWRSSIYGSRSIEQVLREKFSRDGRDLRLSDLKTKVLVPAIDMENRRVVFFENFSNTCPDVELWKVARATSAAEFFFPGFELDGRVLYDGGNAVNNPAAAAMANGWRLWGDNFKLASIGIGAEPKRTNAKALARGPAWLWLFHLVPLLFDSSMEDANYQCTQGLGQNFLRLDPKMHREIPLDGADKASLEALADAGNRYAAWAAPRLAAFVRA